MMVLHAETTLLGSLCMSGGDVLIVAVSRTVFEELFFLTILLKCLPQLQLFPPPTPILFKWLKRTWMICEVVFILDWFFAFTSGFPGGSDGKESACNAGDLGSISGLGRSPWRREGLPTPVFWPGEFHRLYSLQGHKQSDTTERLSQENLFKIPLVTKLC